MKTKNLYFVEMTDTFGGEANYSWARRLNVRASSQSGAIRKARKHWGQTARIRKAWDTGDCARYNVANACVCVFVSFIDNESAAGNELETI